MEVHVQSDMTDGIVLLDPAFFKKTDENILRAMDIFLDKNGESELIYDFPDEEWEKVYVRESKPFVELVEAGEIWIKLFSNIDVVLSVEQTDTLDTKEYVTVISGKMIIVLASELLQCLYYPELDMEILGSLELPNGQYRIAYSTDGAIKYSKVD